MHFKVKQNALSADETLGLAIRNAIQAAKAIKTPEADNLSVLQQHLGVIDKAKIAPLAEAIHKKYLLPTAKTAAISDMKDEKGVMAQATNKHTLAAVWPAPTPFTTATTSTVASGVKTASVQTANELIHGMYACEYFCVITNRCTNCCCITCICFFSTH